MRFEKRTVLSFGMILVLLMLSIPSVVLSDVTAVSPSNIFNDVATIITVTGSGDFDGTSRIWMDGAELPGTLFISATELRVTVPAGTALGQHIITVSNVPGSVVLTVASPPPTATPIPSATSTSAPFARPQMRVNFSGSSGKDGITSNKPFKFTVNFENAGSAAAYSTQAVFTSADLVPLDTGGVAVLGTVSSGAGISVDQRFVSNGSIAGKTIITIDVTLSYNDEKGTAYSDKFTLSVPVSGGGGGSGVYATATPTGIRSGQLIITSYTTTLDPLQPGSQFELVMTVQNLGNDKAQRVTMIVGGGSGSSGGSTPQPGGVSGGSGEFSNFAPVGTSNIQSLGDLPAGGMVQAKQELIVNVSTNPGAYPMKITFSYLNAKGEVVNDEQVVTLLVFGLPNIDVSFYRPPDVFFSGQPGALPIQLVNLGRRTAVLGNITISSDTGIIENGTGLVGNLDAGGFFTLDATYFPEGAGPVTLNIHIDYTDDFNQPRMIEKELKIMVEEGFSEPTPDPNLPMDPSMVPATEETFLQKLWRFLLGLLGLDSAPPASSPEMPLPSDGEMIPAPNGAGG